MKMLLKAILRAVRRAMRAAARAARGVGAFMGGVVDGFFAGAYAEELDEGGLDELVEDTDHSARQRAEQLARQMPDLGPSFATLVREAVRLRSGGRGFDHLFDLDDPEHKRVCAFVHALDEQGMRAVTHMPLGTLERHLDASEFCAVGLRPVGKQIMLARSQAEAARAEAGPVPGRRRRRSPSSTVIAEAASNGRQLTIGELVEATRRAAA